VGYRQEKLMEIALRIQRNFCKMFVESPHTEMDEFETIFLEFLAKVPSEAISSAQQLQLNFLRVFNEIFEEKDRQCEEKFKFDEEKKNCLPFSLSHCPFLCFFFPQRIWRNFTFSDWRKDREDGEKTGRKVE
jgi:hypothetical protein